jgi:acyl-CoA synthetase (AMP-forming)/AMP-acid ligase II
MSLVKALEDVARRQTAAPALAWRGTKWTYGDLQAAIAAVDRGLTDRVLDPGARVALLLRNSPQYVAVYYGALAAELVAVPLNVQERAPVLARQIADSGARLLIGDPAHPEWDRLIRALPRSSIDVLEFKLDDDGPASFRALAAVFASIPRERGDNDGSHAANDHSALATIIYTSGTTGSPKGVMLSQENLRANARAIIASLGLTARDHSLCVLPFHFSYGNSVLHSHLLCGACLTLEDNFAFPHVVLERLQSTRASGFAGVPSTFALLLGRHRLSGFDLGALRYVTQAGGPMPRPLLDKLREQLPGIRVYLMYGQTEASARLTCLPPHDLDRKPGSVGVPIGDVQIEIRDAGGVRPPPGAVGEIWARGPNVMLGYWNDPEATAEVLSGGWLRTRDLGYVDEEGYLFIVGRASDMIKVGAFRVSPQEVEEVLLGLDGVADAAVAGIQDDVLGQAIKAVVVPQHESQLTAMAVKAHCRENLAAYKVPKVVEFATALPRTSSGKVQRFKLVGEAPNR